MEKDLIRDCVEEKEMILSSGLISYFYVDLRPLILSHDEFIHIVAEEIDKQYEFDYIVCSGVGGTVLGAKLSVLFEKDIVVIRTNKKSHGKNKLIEEPKNVNKQANFLLVDDVLTTGKSLHNNILALKSQGYADPIGAYVLLDREEATIDLECSIKSLYKISDLR